VRATFSGVTAVLGPFGLIAGALRVPLSGVGAVLRPLTPIVGVWRAVSVRLRFVPPTVPGVSFTLVRSAGAIVRSVGSSGGVPIRGVGLVRPPEGSFEVFGAFFECLGLRLIELSGFAIELPLEGVDRSIQPSLLGAADRLEGFGPCLLLCLIFGLLRRASTEAPAGDPRAEIGER
jgi:hypothetical protein